MYNNRRRILTVVIITAKTAKAASKRERIKV
jgi:hypothetical protein